MSYLLDTNVISEIRKPAADAHVAAWFDDVGANDLYLSVLVVGEIRQGIERLRHRDADRTRVFEEWLERLKRDFGERVLPVTATIGEVWGRLNASAPLPAIDGLIAATALAHGLTVVTRDTAMLDRLGIAWLSPWAVQ